MRFRRENVGEFLEAAYRYETDDAAWLVEVVERARDVLGRGGPAHGAIYDASDITAFRALETSFIDCSERELEVLREGLGLITPGFVIRTFRSVTAERFGSMTVPEMRPMIDAMGTLGYPEAFNLNGLDPSGLGVIVGLWTRKAKDLPGGQMAIYRRLAHHLGAAHRLRRRLRESQAHRSRLDPTEGAEAILDGRRRIVHAEGAAKAPEAQLELIETSAARDLARTRRRGADESLQRWRPLTSARWTLVDSFERGGARYVVARENQSQLTPLSSLSDRERQVVAYLALGQSTKETAYALGISDVTVRVLAGRAAAKLGVRSRAELLDHADVRPLRPGQTGA